MDKNFKEIINRQNNYGTLQNWVDGKLIAIESNEETDLYCPYNGAVIGQVPLSSETDLKRAMTAANKASLDWQETNIKKRVQVLYRLKNLLENNMCELSYLAALESGKTPAEAKAEIEKGIEVLEFASSLSNTAAGQNMEVSQGVTCVSQREPVGIIASITPFNFPFMVPFWTLPIALACGNTMILKPSEQAPLSALKFAELLKEAGLPDGVFSVLLGSRTIVEAICDHPAISAVSFVGSTRIAKTVYQRGVIANKRVLALGGAKNHIVLMPDADQNFTPKAIVDSATGCAGQRCMAACVLITVGDCQRYIDEMMQYAKSIELGTDMGAIINKHSVDRIHDYIDQAAELGAEIIVDGRHATVQDFDKGYWVGPTLIDHVTQNMPCAHDEIFGPVLSIRHVNTLDEAIQIENENPYGNAASIFTNSGAAADHFSKSAKVGMVGINIGVPVPREPFGFGGCNLSKFGVGDITGFSSINFWTREKKITTKWVAQKESNWMG